MLKNADYLDYGSTLESSIRAGGIVAVEELKNCMMALQARDSQNPPEGSQKPHINCVMIDFFLWDLSKLVECGEVSIDNHLEVLPCHRTRSIYY
jgi:hypothetical protein